MDKLQIVLGSTHCKFKDPISDSLSDAIRKLMRYHPDGYKYQYLYKTKRWDGWSYMYDLRDRSFRTGFLTRIISFLKDKNIEYELVGELPILQRNLLSLPDFSFPRSPHQYQRDAADATEAHTHGLVVSPTGSGKSYMMALTIEKYKTTTLVVVNTRDLLDQLSSVFNKIVPGGVGVVGDGTFELKDITVATIQTIASVLGIGKKQKATGNEPLLKKWLNTVQLLIIDEAHGADSNSMNGLCERVKAAKTIGFTATPYAWDSDEEKQESLMIEANMGEVIYDTRGKVDFIGVGINVPLFVRRINAPIVEEYANAAAMRGQDLDYKDVVDNQVINNQERTAMIADVVRDLVRDGKSVYVYFNRLAYGDALEAAMDDLVTAKLTGSTPTEERREILEALRKKELLVVISDVGSYGLDVPSLDVVLLSTPSKDIRQLVGRVIRSHADKTIGMLIDIVDNVPMLKNHAKTRHAQYLYLNATIFG